jgi:hypothetical protein
MQTRTGNPGALFLIFILIAVLLFMFFQAVATMPQVQIPSYTDHPQDRHADVIASATTCFSGHGTISPVPMINRTTNRNAWICWMDNQFFIWITNKDDGSTITMFKNKAKSLFDAIKYLTNAGYQ